MKTRVPEQEDRAVFRTAMWTHPAFFCWHYPYEASRIKRPGSDKRRRRRFNGIGRYSRPHLGEISLSQVLLNVSDNIVLPPVTVFDIHHRAAVLSLPPFRNRFLRAIPHPADRVQVVVHSTVIVKYPFDNGKILPYRVPARKSPEITSQGHYFGSMHRRIGAVYMMPGKRPEPPSLTRERPDLDVRHPKVLTVPSASTGRAGPWVVAQLESYPYRATAAPTEPQYIKTAIVRFLPMPPESFDCSFGWIQGRQCPFSFFLRSFGAPSSEATRIAGLAPYRPPSGSKRSTRGYHIGPRDASGVSGGDQTFPLGCPVPFACRSQPEPSNGPFALS